MSYNQNNSIELSELQWVHVFEASLGWVDNMWLSWLSWDSLGDDFLSSFLSLNLFGIVGLDSFDEGLSAS